MDVQGDALTMFRLGFVALLAWTLAVQSACAPTPTPAPTPAPASLTLAGDKAMHTLAQALIAAYAERYPQVRLSLETGAERNALQVVRERRADIGLAARPLAADEMGDLIATPITYNFASIYFSPV